jgi:hypothetical protein
MEDKIYTIIIKEKNINGEKTYVDERKLCGE